MKIKLKIILFTLSCSISLLLIDNLYSFVFLKNNENRYEPNKLKKIDHLEFSYSFKTNKNGLRYNDSELDTNSKKEYRVLVCGDSFTEGFGVENRYRFSDILEDEFMYNSKICRFINCAISGTNPHEYLFDLEKLVSIYKPHLVMICIYPNDIAGTTSRKNWEPYTKNINLKSLLNTLYPYSYKTVRKLFKSDDKFKEHVNFPQNVVNYAKSIELDEYLIDEWVTSIPEDLITAVRKEMFNGSVLTKGLLYKEFWKDSLDIDTIDSVNRFNNMIKVIEYWRKKINIKFLFVLIPSPYQCQSSFHDSNAIQKITGCKLRNIWLRKPTELENKFSNYTHKNNLLYLDLTPYFRDSNKTLLYHPLDGHFNALGHRLAANTLINYFASNDIFELHF